MIAAKADRAVLACTGGFTRGVEKFAQGKSIRLVSASYLVELAGSTYEPDTQKQFGLERD